MIIIKIIRRRNKENMIENEIKEKTWYMFMFNFFHDSSLLKFFSLMLTLVHILFCLVFEEFCLSMYIDPKFGWNNQIISVI